ncbi:MAG: hypothetical protein K8W52_31430 [Deltaproteobacteria bacterium]|nr:hypothetical protein [Deltaproteobacteria bacterium]
MSDPEHSSRIRNPGGTSGGIGEFLAGVLLLGIGGYLFLDNVVVTTGWDGGWGRFGVGRFTTSFGVALLPLMGGVALLFYDGKSKLGWILTVASGAAIFVGIVTSLTVHWRQTSLLVAIVIFVAIAGGIGFIARGLRAH